jgi:hypothetical protein
MASDPQPRIDLYGMAVALPAGWENHTVYQFAAPEPVVDESARLRSKTRPKTPFRANLVATCHTVPPQIPLAAIFTGPNSAAREQNPSHQVVATGVGRCLDRDVVWQDVAFFEPAIKLQIYQRQIGSKLATDRLLVLTLTTDQKLDELCSQLGLVIAPADAAR